VQTAAQAEASIAACLCEKRATDGRPCSEDTAANKLIESAERGCAEELRGMPDTPFKKQAQQDCVCRVQTSAGYPCVALEEKARRADLDKEFEAACREKQAEAQMSPIQHAKAVKDCVCGWAKGVMPSLCVDEEEMQSVRAQIEKIASGCKNTMLKKGKVADREKMVRDCTCKGRKKMKNPCLESGEWAKVKSAVNAQHATCSKLNRRRRAPAKADAAKTEL